MRDGLVAGNFRFGEAADIAEFLRQEGLAFIGMDVDESTQRRFENIPGNVDEVMCWDAFEKTYPDTFMGTYQFWVQSAR